MWALSAEGACGLWAPGGGAGRSSGYGDAVLRTALRPRWLALLLVVLVVASAMAWLGSWQLDRARAQGRDAVTARQSAAPVPLAGVLRARRPFTAAAADRSVVTDGRWDGAHQVLVAGRRLDGVRGLWVLTPLLLADGSAVAVVRGWVPSASDPAAVPPAGEGSRPDGGPAVRVSGVLRPAEPPEDRAPGADDGLPAGQVARVDVTDLVRRWPYPLLTGYLVMTAQDPAPAGPAPRAVPPSAGGGGGGLALRNLSYAVQWWLFAAFGLLLWLRLVRDDHLGRLPAGGRRVPVPAGGPGAGGGPGVGDDGPARRPGGPDRRHPSPPGGPT